MRRMVPLISLVILFSSYVLVIMSVKPQFQDALSLSEVFIKSTMKHKHLAITNITCHPDTTHYCLGNQACCPSSTGNSGCCPYQFGNCCAYQGNAVNQCCPNGYNCLVKISSPGQYSVVCNSSSKVYIILLPLFFIVISIHIFTS